MNSKISKYMSTYKTYAIPQVSLLAAVMLCISIQAGISQIACNNSVQISMDEFCEVTIKPDMIMEGEYPDYDAFSVQIDGVIGQLITQPGDYAVTITETGTNNSCWSNITVSDKLGPQLFCEPVYLPCTADVSPGQRLEQRYIAQGSVIKYDHDTLHIVFDFDPQIPYGATVNDIALDLHLSHQDIKELQGYLISPTGRRTMLFDKPLKNITTPSCRRSGMMLSLHDSSDKPYSMMDDPQACQGHAEPSIHGAYQPHDPFSTYYEHDAAGIWHLKIADVSANDYHPELKFTKLKLNVHSGYVGLPFDGIVEVENLGNQRIRISGDHVCGVVEASYSDAYDKNCFEEGAYYGRVNRTWQVEDASGNLSTCVQPIYYEATYFNDVDMPYNYDGDKMPSFKCNDEFGGMVTEDGYPSPEMTGEPSDWRSIHTKACGNLQITYKDLKIDVCENSYKLLRTWTLINWCESSQLNAMEHTQVIVVKDDIAPVIECPSPYSLNVAVENYQECSTDLKVPAPIVHYECSSYTWTVQYYSTEHDKECEEPATENFTSRRVVRNGEDVIIEDLPIGCLWIKYVVTDDCGNTSEVICQAQVTDKTPPVAVCEEETIISLGSDGYAKVYAETFDDLSWDNCGEIADYRVRKIDNVCDTVDYARDFVKFCCLEVGTTILVELQVFDHYGNKNACKIKATIQDKFLPHLHCPDTVYVDCQTPITSLSDELYGKPQAGDNCAGVVLPHATFRDSLDQCGAGYVFKTWTVSSVADSVVTDECTQIFIFEANSQVLRHDVYFPNDTTLVGCAAMSAPSLLGEPVIHKEGCSLLAISHEDTRFSFVDDACEKIIREWSVVDWCKYKPSQGQNDGYWTQTQIIKLTNEEAPVFNDVCVEVDICSSSRDCSSGIRLSAAATDECTPVDELVWEYSIDLYNNGSIDITSKDVNYSADSVYIMVDSMPLDATHKIKWTVSDGCQNYAYCQYTFRVKDCKAPTPYCLGDIVTTVMSTSGEVDIWANDFDLGAEDNCTAQEHLMFSFSRDTSETSMRFTCDDLPTGTSLYVAELEVWVTDENGNQDFCTVELSVQDNVNACPDSGNNNSENPNVGETTTSIEGRISTMEGISIDDVTVRVASSEPGFPRVFNTDDRGTFSFAQLPMGSDYSLTARREDEYLNGVSTIDIVAIQQHILGNSKLTNPYRIIAADVDNNGVVSVSDLITLRQVLLGVIPSFPNGQGAWRFISQNYAFTDEKSPFPYTEEIVVQQLNRRMIDAHFMGVKIGDVNGNAVTKLSPQSEIRSAEAATFFMHNQLFSRGEIVSAELMVESETNLYGYQHTLKYDVDYLTLLSVTAGQIQVQSDHYVVDEEAGTIHFSWSQPESAHLNPGDKIVELSFRANGDGALSNLLIVDPPKGLSPEIYDENMEAHKLSIEFKEKISEVILVHNWPNPFSNHTTIEFQLPEDADVSILIHDASGKKVYDYMKSYKVGHHEVVINPSILPKAGVYYYSVSGPKGSITKKMIKLQQ